MHRSRVITPAMLVAMGCVQRGAAWLDHILPGWYRAINLLKLNIRDCDNCLLAQATNMQFNPACKMLGLTWYSACTFGFDIQSGTTVCYDDLHACWVEEIMLRLQSDAEIEDAALASLHCDDTVVHVTGEWGEPSDNRDQKMLATLRAGHAPPFTLAIA